MSNLTNYSIIMGYDFKNQDLVIDYSTGNCKVTARQEALPQDQSALELKALELFTYIALVASQTSDENKQKLYDKVVAIDKETMKDKETSADYEETLKAIELGIAPPVAKPTKVPELLKLTTSGFGHLLEEAEEKRPESVKQPPESARKEPSKLKLSTSDLDAALKELGHKRVKEADKGEEPLKETENEPEGKIKKGGKKKSKLTQGKIVSAEGTLVGKKPKKEDKKK